MLTLLRVPPFSLPGSPSSGATSCKQDLSGWTLTGGIDFTFHPGTVIVSDGVIYVSPDQAMFRARATGPSGGQELFVIGPYDAHVGMGEEVILSDTTGRVIHRRSFGPFSSGN